MIRTLHAYTYEIDDPQLAVEEILEQIDLDDLSSHSVAVLGCNLEYIQNGTTKKLSDALPFSVIGGTTNIIDVAGEAGEDMLALIVLTSDDVSFSTIYSEPLTEEAESRIADAYNAAAKELPEEPAIGIFVSPFIVNLSGDKQVRALNKASGDTPLFGTIALDFTDKVGDPYTIYNGESSMDRMALLLLSGEVNSSFYFASIPDDCFVKQKAVITSSHENALIEVNNMSASAYIESLGLAERGQVLEIPSIPLSIDIGDGKPPVARAILARTPDGQVICGGDMPEGASLGVGAIDSDVVVDTAETMAQEIVDTHSDCNGVLIFSCLSRNLALGLEPMAEVERIQKVFQDKIPYLFLYSAGEIYPDKSFEGSPSQFHNDSIIAWVY